ncbi:MAG: M61 family peptidase [Tahibacter sp.]
MTCLSCAPLSVGAEVGVGPQPALASPPIPAPRDVVFNGSISLAVDVSDTQHKIAVVRESIPVQAAGPLILLYPAWESASHARTASVADLAGLVIKSGNRVLAWTRDPVDMHAFRVDVPDNTRSIDVEFQYLSRASSGQLRQDMVVVPWHRMLLYPAGWFARNISVTANLTLPSELQAFSSLEIDRRDGDVVVFKPTTLETLTDSPVYAARYARQISLAPKSAAPVLLDVLADDPKDLTETAGEVEKLRRMVEQTQRLFHSVHYAHYDAIATLSDALSPTGGIEHLESGENMLAKNYFSERNLQLNNVDLIAHEFVHSWNGRFRQPADLWTPTLNVPMRTRLLWVYEGQTEFWGRVLAARSGLRSRQETLDKLALDAAVVARRPGRNWKSLSDSTNDPLFMIGQTVAWRDWQRREDYYAEGVMLWLDVDGMMRELSRGQRGLDDFARAFFGIHDGSRTTVVYTADDVYAALGKIVPYDWSAYLQHRLEGHDEVVLDGLTRLGWRLDFTDTPTATFLQDEADWDITNLAYSIGLTVGKTGALRAVTWHGPAFDAGLAPGVRIVSVNGKAFDPVVLKEAVMAASTTPIELAVESEGRTRTAKIAYRGSLRYPVLVRIPGRSDRLSALLAPRH